MLLSFLWLLTTVFTFCSNRALDRQCTRLAEETGDLKASYLPLLLPQTDVVQMLPRCWQETRTKSCFYFSIDTSTDHSNYHWNRTCQLRIQKSCWSCCAQMCDMLLHYFSLKEVRHHKACISICTFCPYNIWSAQFVSANTSVPKHLLSERLGHYTLP